MTFHRSAGRAARVRLVPALAAAMLLASASSGGAQTILVDSNSNFVSGAGTLFNSGAKGGQQFTLSSANTITSVDSTVKNFLGAAGVALDPGGFGPPVV